MRRIVVAVLGIAGLVGSTLALAPAASAGPSFAAQQELISTTENLWRVSYVNPNDGCGTPEFFVIASINGSPVEPVSQEVESAGSILVTMPPEGPAGTMEFLLDCGGSTSPTQALYAIVAVDKVVEGHAPSDAAYRVRVECSEAQVTEAGFGDDGVGAAQDAGPFVAQLDYGRDGGRAYVYSDAPRTCDVTESGTANATSTSVDPGTVEIDEPATFTVTVTNTYAAPPPIELLPTFTG